MEYPSINPIVIEVLRQTASQDFEILKLAESKLKEWETQEGFYSQLFNIVVTHSIDSNIRWMAVVYLKNGVNRYWRKTLPNAISEQEKSVLRQILLKNLNEPVNQIAVQLAELISRVARIDCPKEWPELMPTLLQGIESNNTLIQHRSLLILHQVVKALCSKRFIADMKYFTEFTKNIYSFILNLWNNFTELFLRDMANNSAPEIITENLEKALLCLRILRKLTVFGFDKPSQCPEAMCFLNIIFDRAKVTLENRKQLRGKGIVLLELCEKFIIHLTKILLDFYVQHPYCSIEIIKPTLEFTYYFLFTSEGTQFTYERFIIQCFNLIKSTLLCKEYKLRNIVSSKNTTIVLKAHQSIQDFFQNDILTEMCQKLVKHYFLLNQDDLAMWESDPETFAIDKVGDNWKYSLRPCIETVFVALFHEYKNILTPVLLDLVRSMDYLTSHDDLSQILQKDAIYNAVGLTANDLFNEIDFAQWFTNNLTEELKIKTNNYRIIKRRVTWLIGCWIVLKFSTKLLSVLYNIILNLLQSNEDMVIRLTATSTLRIAADDFNFSFEQFEPFIEPTFISLFNLLKECQECETKMHVLNVLSPIIERVKHKITPHCEPLVQYLPLLWQEAEDHNMLRCVIVSTFVLLLKATGCIEDKIYPFLILVIQLGTDINQQQIVYLLEECLLLWIAVLENSKIMTNELMQLFSNMPKLIEYSTENLRHCYFIVKNHVLLAPDQSLKTQMVPVISSFDTIMFEIRDEGIIDLLKVIETCIRASPDVALTTIKPILPKIFEALYKHDAADDLGVITQYLFIVSRVLITSFDVFNEMMLYLAQKYGESYKKIFDSIMQIWLHKMSYLGNTERMKLLALAMLSLLTVQSPLVLDKFSAAIIPNIVHAMDIVLKTDENGTVDILLNTLNQTYIQEDYHFVDPEFGLCFYLSEYEKRKKRLLFIDPVYTVDLKKYVEIQMNKLKLQIGPVMFDQLLQAVNPQILHQLKEFVDI